MTYIALKSHRSVEQHPSTFPTGSVIGTPEPEGSAATLPQRFREAFVAAGHDLQVRALGQLLRNVGTMALLVIGKGAFARFATASSFESIGATSKPPAHVDADAIADLVRYLEQREPHLPRRVLAKLEAGEPGTGSALSAPEL